MGSPHDRGRWAMLPMLRELPFRNAIRSHPRASPMSPDLTTPIAFTSYSHEDNEHNNDFARELAIRLKREVRSKTGRLAFEVFIDKKDLRWGQAWRARIDAGIADSTFLVAIVSPLFLESEECRREVLRFAELEEARGRDDLILPVYYIDDPRMNRRKPPEVPTEAEEVARLLSSRQFIDWRPLRYRDWTDSLVRAKLGEAAEQLITAIATVKASSPPAASAPPALAGSTPWVVDQAGGHFRTLGGVLDKCGPTDRVYVRPGVYDITDLRISRPIEIVGQGQKDLIVLRSTSEDGLVCDATSFVLKDLRIAHEPSGDSGAAIRILSPAGSIAGCLVESRGKACVEVGRDSKVLLHGLRLTGATYGLSVPQRAEPLAEGCEISGAARAGILCNLNSAPTVRGCRIHSNGHAVWLHHGAGGRFERNDLRGNRQGAWNRAPEHSASAADNLE